MNRNNVVSEIQKEDIEQLQIIMKQAFENNLSSTKANMLYKIYKNNKDIYVLGYYIENVLVGTVTLNILTTPTGKEATIWNLAVLEKYRRLGIASKLMIKAEEIVKKYEDINRIWLFSGYQREKAHKLYKKLGYNEKLDKAFVKQIN